MAAADTVEEDTIKDMIMEEVEVDMTRDTTKDMIIMVEVAVEADIPATNWQKVQNHQNPSMEIMMRNLDQSILKQAILKNHLVMDHLVIWRNQRDQNQRSSFMNYLYELFWLCIER